VVHLQKKKRKIGHKQTNVTETIGITLETIVQKTNTHLVSQLALDKTHYRKCSFNIYCRHWKKQYHLLGQNFAQMGFSIFFLYGIWAKSKFQGGPWTTLATLYIRQCTWVMI
jgi:hypothetical protein